MKNKISKLLKKSFEVPEINEIVNLLKNQFGTFYRPFLYYVYEELNEYVNKKENVTITNANELIKGILYDVNFELAEMCTKTLLAEFYAYKESRIYVESKGSSLYNEYYRKIEEKAEINRILEKYTVLFEVISNYLKQRIRYVKECIEDFERDKNDIFDKFGFRDDVTIYSIRITSGDTHHEGRKVANVIIGEDTILYKPRSLETEHIFYDLTDILCKEEKFCFRRLKDVTKDKHSWQEWVSYQEAETIEDVKCYYYRVGILLFALDLINSHDVHRENIIACKDMPILIDMETLVDAGAKKPIAGDPSLKYINMECTNSVIGTLLLPTNCIHMAFDFDVSGLAGKAEYESDRWYDFVLINQGTDSIGLEKTFKLQFSDEGINLLRHQGEVVNPQDYVDEILDGYQNAYECFCEKTDKIRKMFCDSTLQIRQVLRPTAVYAKFLQASMYFEYLKSKEKYNYLFEKLRSKIWDGKNEFEIQDLINRDVPYFFSQIGENALCSHRGRIENYFENSSLSIVLDNLEQINNKYIEKQKYYIRLALSTLKNKHEKIHRLPLLVSCDNMDEILLKIANVMEEKMFWNKEKTECYLLTTTIIREKRTISMLNYNIYDGGGVIVYYIGMYLTTKKESYRKIIKGLYRACLSTKAINGFQEMGVFVGKMSYIYMYYLLYKYLHFEHCKEQIETIKEEVYKSLDVEEVENDVVSGLAGMVLLSVAIIEDKKIDGFNMLLSKTANMLAKRCEEILINNDLCKTGFAHGLSGMALAMYKAGNCLKRQEYMELAMRCVKKENEFFDQVKGNWKDHRDGKSNLSYWCYGSPGILLARIQMQKIRYNENLELDIKRGCKAVKIQHGDTQCLCHGQLGNLNIIKMLVDYYPQNESLLDYYETAKELIQKEIKEDGCFFGSRDLLEDYSFMQGLSGMGYELLRWKNPKLPNILALEV